MNSLSHKILYFSGGRANTVATAFLWLLLCVVLEKDIVTCTLLMIWNLQLVFQITFL